MEEQLYEGPRALHQQRLLALIDCFFSFYKFEPDPAFGHFQLHSELLQPAGRQHHQPFNRLCHSGWIVLNPSVEITNSSDRLIYISLFSFGADGQMFRLVSRGGRARKNRMSLT